MPKIDFVELERLLVTFTDAQTGDATERHIAKQAYQAYLTECGFDQVVASHLLSEWRDCWNAAVLEAWFEENVERHSA